jgi:molybdopterin molybdotransferase
MNPLIDGSWGDARRIAFAVGTPMSAEKVPLSKSLGRTLARNIDALIDLPPDTTSAMDGYAVAGTGPWEVVGEVSRSTPDTTGLRDGTALRISTGGVVPKNTFAIIRWEQAEIAGNQLTGLAIPDRDIRPAGLECAQGERIAQIGTVVTPGLMGLLAASGFDELVVFRRPKVAVVLTGDEIIRQGLPKTGFVRDSIGTMLPGWLEKLGCELVETRYITDSQGELARALLSVAQSAELEQIDLIITTGGTARGVHDHLHGALAEISAEVHIDGVATRPGHPMILAKRKALGILGLPGNPHSAIAALMTLGGSMIAAMLGRDWSQIEPLERVRSREALRAPDDSTRLILGTLTGGTFVMGDHLGSGMLRGLAFATGFAVVPPGGIEAGEAVGWLALP